MARDTLPTKLRECIGGPFDGDAVACRDDSMIELSWDGVLHGRYVPLDLDEGATLHWVPSEGP
jgi:hypothetical protein